MTARRVRRTAVLSRRCRPRWARTRCLVRRRVVRCLVSRRLSRCMVVRVARYLSRARDRLSLVSLVCPGVTLVLRAGNISVTLRSWALVVVNLRRVRRSRARTRSWCRVSRRRRARRRLFRSRTLWHRRCRATRSRARARRAAEVARRP